MSLKFHFVLNQYKYYGVYNDIVSLLFNIKNQDKETIIEDFL